MIRGGGGSVHHVSAQLVIWPTHSFTQTRSKSWIYFLSPLQALPPPQKDYPLLVPLPQALPPLLPFCIRIRRPPPLHCCTCLMKPHPQLPIWPPSPPRLLLTLTLHTSPITPPTTASLLLLTGAHSKLETMPHESTAQPQTLPTWSVTSQPRHHTIQLHTTCPPPFSAHTR